MLFQACSTYMVRNKQNFKELVILFMFLSCLNIHSFVECIKICFVFLKCHSGTYSQNCLFYNSVFLKLVSNTLKFSRLSHNSLLQTTFSFHCPGIQSYTINKLFYRTHQPILDNVKIIIKFSTFKLRRSIPGIEKSTIEVFLKVSLIHFRAS